MRVDMATQALWQMEMRGLDGVLDTLQSLPKETVARGPRGPVSQAARVGLNVVRDQARINLMNSLLSYPTREGREFTRHTGQTAKAVVVRRRRMPPGQKGERMLLTVNYKPHPNYTHNEYRNRPIHFNDIAYFVEIGDPQGGLEAKPWLRPAYIRKWRAAAKASEVDLTKRLDRIIAKLEAKNRTAV